MVKAFSSSQEHASAMPIAQVNVVRPSTEAASAQQRRRPTSKASRDADSAVTASRKRSSLQNLLARLRQLQQPKRLPTPGSTAMPRVLRMWARETASSLSQASASLTLTVHPNAAQERLEARAAHAQLLQWRMRMERQAVGSSKPRKGASAIVDGDMER